MRTTMRKVIPYTLLAFLLFGCAGEKVQSTPPSAKGKPVIHTTPELKQQELKMITVRGTIKYKNLEGGFWALDAEDGRKFMPSGLDKALLVDGIVVEVTGVIEEDVITFQQYGKTLKIKSSRVIDDSNTSRLNSY